MATYYRTQAAQANTDCGAFVNAKKSKNGKRMYCIELTRRKNCYTLLR